MKNQNLPLQTIDALAWAKEFIKCKNECNWSISDIDEGLMLGWFANAMMTMHDHILNEQEKEALDHYNNFIKNLEKSGVKINPNNSNV